jgi:hypothetical protein
MLGGKGSRIFTEACWVSETLRQSFASTRPHYQLNRGTHFRARATDGDPAPPIASPKTFRRQDRSISFGPRPSRVMIQSSLYIRLAIFASAWLNLADQRARSNIFRASLLNAPLVFVLPKPRRTTRLVICAKLSFGWSAAMS